MEDIRGKVALVTGGTRGIGRAIASSLVEAGVKVAICGRIAESVECAVRELRPAGGELVGWPADVARPEAVEALFAQVDRHFGGLDYLINNAGEGVFRKVGEMSVADWHRNIDLNLNGAFYCSRQALPRMASRGGGFIINISSLAAKNPFSGGAAYNASKFGLNGFTEAMMLDHRQENIRFSSIMPGSVDTEFAPAAGRDNRWKIAPEDIAEVVLMLLRMPARTMVSRVEMRPSKPPK